MDLTTALVVLAGAVIAQRVIWAAAKRLTSWTMPRPVESEYDALFDEKAAKAPEPRKTAALRPVPSTSRVIPQGRLSRRLRQIEEELLPVEEKKLVVSLASTREDFEAAARLVYEQYRSYGYQQPNAQKMRLNLWNALPGSYALVAKKGDKVIGTATYIMDSDAGLPTDEIAKEELDGLRARNRTLCEISALAVDVDYSDPRTVLELFRFGYKIAREHLHVTDYVMTVNPKHEKFYLKMLLFEKLAEVREYSKVKGAPGIPMRLNLETAEGRYFTRYGGREGSRDLHRFFTIDGQAEMTRSVEASLAARKSFLTMDFLLSMFYSRIDMLKDPADYATFTRQWFEHYLRTTAASPAPFFRDLSRQTRRWNAAAV